MKLNRLSSRMRQVTSTLLLGILSTSGISSCQPQTHTASNSEQQSAAALVFFTIPVGAPAAIVGGAVVVAVIAGVAIYQATRAPQSVVTHQSIEEVRTYVYRNLAHVRRYAIDGEQMQVTRFPEGYAHAFPNDNPPRESEGILTGVSGQITVG